MLSVLVIEGDPVVARMLAEVFAFKGWQTETRSDKVSALEALGGSRAFDVILVSYKVPGTNGIEFARLAATSDQHRDTPVVLITGSRSIEGDAKDAGVCEIIHKPFSIHRLIEVVQSKARTATAALAAPEG